jgi:methylated-DNA-protein-cysteine methyltransferase-like protein
MTTRRGGGSGGGSMMSSGPSFFRRVFALTRRIPRGRVTTYGALARALGVPRGARTVGWALGACPDDVPWHRVVNARGAISWRPSPGFRLQRALLRAEGVRFNRRGRIDLAKFGWRAL